MYVLIIQFKDLVSELEIPTVMYYGPYKNEYEANDNYLDILKDSKLGVSHFEVREMATYTSHGEKLNDIH